MSLNNTLAELFKTAAAVMEIKGEPVFKAIAFSKVSRVLEGLSIDIKKAVDEGTVEEIEGIGKSSRKIIEDFVKTGKSPDVDDLLSSIPSTLLPMMNIPSLGPKTIAMFWKERKITSIDELKKALEDGSLEGLKGVGDKKIQSIKEGIALLESSGGRKGLIEVFPIATLMLEQVRKMKTIRRAEVAGSLRRWKETIGDVDIVASVASKDEDATSSITKLFVELPQVTKILGQGETKASVLVENGLQIDLRIVPDDNFGAAIQYFTGSKEHNVKLRGLAQDKGMTLNEWGLYKVAEYDKAKKEIGRPPAIKPVASKNEEDIYKALGLKWMEPELREDRGEIDQALKGKLPKLITQKDLKGDLHTHTTASDGVNSIEEMAEAAKELGYEYLGISDHSKSQVIANGLSAERLLNHVEAIRKIGSKIKGIKLLASCEVDILVDGRLDYDDDVLKELDYVVASPHVSLKQEPEKATERLLRAIDNPHVTIIGHPTGRLINQRSGLSPDFEKLFERAKKACVALEINAGWPRLDLNDIHARAAIAAGVVLSINTDAHSTDQLSGMSLGLSVARRAGVEAENVINTFDYKSLLAFIAKKK